MSESYSRSTLCECGWVRAVCLVWLHQSSLFLHTRRFQETVQLSVSLFIQIYTYIIVILSVRYILNVLGIYRKRICVCVCVLDLNQDLRSIYYMSSNTCTCVSMNCISTAENWTSLPRAFPRNEMLLGISATLISSVYDHRLFHGVMRFCRISRTPHQCVSVPQLRYSINSTNL